VALVGGLGHPAGQAAGHEAIELNYIEEARFDNLVQG